MNAFDYFFELSGNSNHDAVVGKERVSYKTLRYNALTTALQLNHMHGENNYILLISDNSVFFITIYLAILKSGNICVPLNPAIEPENFRKVQIKTGASIAFVSQRYASKFSGLDLIIYNNPIPEIRSERQKHKTSDDTKHIFDENRTAEIIFTSGSTGEQKGVIITHKNIIANTHSILEYLKLDKTDTIEVVMPFFYCYGLSLMHTHLRVGGSMHLNNHFIFLGGVIDDLNKYNCTGFAGVPSHFQILLRKTKEFKKTAFPSLRYVTQAGGKLHTAFIKEFTTAFPDINFYVMYGQTEATARLSYLPPGEIQRKSGSIGRGIPGVELKVVNENGIAVTPGETGEIMAKGDNIMIGYLNDNEATKATLRDGWLHTGDLATVDEDGYIYLQSRTREIIKVRGIRVSPKEIEAVIVNYPDVIDCTVYADSSETEGESISAIVYVNDSEINQFSADKIRQHCAQSLASYKVPQKITFTAQLMFNSSGKKSKY